MGIICLRHIDPRDADGADRARGWDGTGGEVARTPRPSGCCSTSRSIACALHRVEARIAVGNSRSMRAFERLGAAREGVLAESFFKDGRYHDQHLYVILEQDWRCAAAARRAVRTDGHND